MIWTKTICESCGPVTVNADRFRLTLDDEGAGFYRFECPICGHDQTRVASPPVVTVLLSAGGRLTNEHEHGLITDDEIDEFTRGFDGDIWAELGESR